MPRRSRSPLALAALLACAAVPLTGCHVDTHNNGSDKNVNIATPFGGLSVKTDDTSINATGLGVYPGAARRVRKNKDASGADVNIQFGGFHVGVKAVDYETPDAPSKVEAFYRKDLARYGAVVLCQDDKPVGQPTHTQDGLGCEQSGKHVHAGDLEGALQLKAGSPRHQYVVGVEPSGTGTHFNLVLLDLPGGIDLGGDDSDDKQ